jgi:hypothetical protein
LNSALADSIGHLWPSSWLATATKTLFSVRRRSVGAVSFRQLDRKLPQLVDPVQLFKPSLQPSPP